MPRAFPRVALHRVPPAGLQSPPLVPELLEDELTIGPTSCLSDPQSVTQSTIGAQLNQSANFAEMNLIPSIACQIHTRRMRRCISSALNAKVGLNRDDPRHRPRILSK